MNSTILEAQALTKTYRQTTALDHIHLKLERGKIYGFIGQNGAGKTTVLRLITGLAFPSGGSLALWGQSGDAQLQEQRKRIGCMIETPALLNMPELLILDEPINGLDPAGIVEIRNLLKSLNKEYGMTILVSSHILEELYQTASEFILIDK